MAHDDMPDHGRDGGTLIGQSMVLRVRIHVITTHSPVFAVEVPDVFDPCMTQLHSSGRAHFPRADWPVSCAQDRILGHIGGS